MGNPLPFKRKKGHICFHSRPAAGVISFLVHSSKRVNEHNAVAGDLLQVAEN
jgi:hypothetical protein